MRNIQVILLAMEPIYYYNITFTLLVFYLQAKHVYVRTLLDDKQIKAITST